MNSRYYECGLQCVRLALPLLGNTKVIYTTAALHLLATTYCGISYCQIQQMISDIAFQAIYNERNDMYIC